MKKICAVLIFFLLTGKYSTAQYFERIYPGLNLGYIGSLDNTVDSGFIICGTQDGGFLMKILQGGDTEWTARDTGNVQHSAAVIQDASGNFTVIGSGNSIQYSSEAVVATYDASGDPITHFRIPPADGWGSWGTTISRSPDRTLEHYCYYVDGYTSDNAYFLDNQDVIAGDMTVVGLNSITMDNNGNYYAAANLAFDMDSLFTWRNNVLVLSSNHFLRTEYFFDTDLSSAAITFDGGVLLAGIFDSLGTKYLRLLKFDSAVNLLWETYIADSELFAVSQVSQTSDGGYAILCTADDGINIHIAFIKADASGAETWKQEFYGNGTALPRNFVRLDDGYAILGNTNGDPYVIRTDSLGRTNATGLPAVASTKNTFKIYPNPSNGIVQISLSEANNPCQYISVLDITGRVVYHKQLFDNKLTIDLSFLAKGVYQCMFTSSTVGQSRSTLVIQ